MIDKEKKFEAAATVYAKETWNHEEDQFMCIDGFKEGAKWAQKEFVNSLWHDASEEPEKFKPCLVYGVFTYEGEEPIEDYCTSVYTSYGWAEDYFPRDYEPDIVRWCYIDDILPKEGGKK